jgi:hypothetical protein
MPLTTSASWWGIATLNHLSLIRVNPRDPALLPTEQYSYRQPKQAKLRDTDQQMGIPRKKNCIKSIRYFTLKVENNKFIG